MLNIKNFGIDINSKLNTQIQNLDLIAVQKSSYEWFIKNGLNDLLTEISPIKDYSDRGLELSFINYYFDEPRFDEATSKAKNITYEAPLRVLVRLTNTAQNEIKEQEVYFGDIPLMTERGTFIINGVERTVVSQLIRSSGIIFSAEVVHGRRLYGAKLIPDRGAWIEFNSDANGVIWVRIDRKRKIPVTSFLRALGYGSDEELLALFKDTDNHPNIKHIDVTLAKDSSHNEEEGILEVYSKIRPGDRIILDSARALIHSMFFKFNRYDLGAVGRYKLNKKFGGDTANITKENRILNKEDIVSIVKEIIRLNINQSEPDDIDHLGNRRVRAIGELLLMRFRTGLMRIERIIKDRMSTLELENITPNRLINTRPLIGVVSDFFMSFQLSQFMDQTNPLAELEHKRRLSAMGPGGLHRERAGFEVRDVHKTHYGRICPVATPEGPNIGLVGHIATYAKVNEYGFIETPYRKVVHKTAADGTVKVLVTDEICYLDATEEDRYVICPYLSSLDDKGYMTTERVEVRKCGEPAMASILEVDFMDMTPNQITSVSTSLIPFVEHNDAVRALMGTNMQRQGIPVIKPDIPLVGTGMEALAARNSGYLITAKRDGEVVKLDSSNIDILTKDGTIDNYVLTKFAKSNTSTCINQFPIINLGDRVEAGQILCDTHSISQGHLSLGQNLLVAFMSFDGYNYEDAIILSQALVERDVFTSIRLDTYICDVRDTRLGPEVITFDIPNISEEKLKNLDEEGVVRVGAVVKAGDILVGKITPKGEVELSPEEKLLRAVFGEKSKDVKDSSLYLQYGEYGKVTDIKIFSREAGDKLSTGIIKSVHITVANLRKIQVGDKLAGRHGNKGVVSKILPVEDMPHLADGTPIDIILSPLGVISRMNLGQILESHLGFASHKLNYISRVQSFGSVSEEEIKSELKLAGLPEDGKSVLYDGRSGKAFDNKVTVGYLYVLKLNHMVDDKMHQRSIGPYSPVTQQPLGGKAQFGGQRFGEMEVWALEAYGAANTLQEILTIKSDDTIGRSEAYAAIVKGEKIKTLNIPESFNVLVNELKGLGLEVETD